jgi:hypothetical protein
MVTGPRAAPVAYPEIPDVVPVQPTFADSATVRFEPDPPFTGARRTPAPAAPPKLSYLEDTTLTLIRPVFGPPPRNAGAYASRPYAGASHGDDSRPGVFMDEATLKITPRRRRVSEDGLLEDIG